MKGCYLLRFFAYCVILSLKCSLVSSQSCGLSTVSLSASRNSSQVLTSPGYPFSSYNQLITCRWSITAPSGYRVLLNFTDFLTYQGISMGKCESYSDTLQVYDTTYESSSKLLGKYCGTGLPASVVSTGRYLFLKFSSNSLGSYSSRKGFSLKYTAVRAPSGISSTCSPYNTAYTNRNIRLASYNYSKYIQSPLYPNKYPSNMGCVWYITASSSSKRIYLTLSLVKIYSYSSSIYSCTFGGSSTQDVLTIRDGSSTSSKVLKTICNSLSSSTTVMSSGRYMTIQFNSNDDNYFGTSSTARFKLKYQEIIVSGPSVCSPSNSFFTNNNIRLKASSSSKYIESPLYPYQYPTSTQCTWYITASSSSKRIELTLSDVKIFNQYSYSCSAYSSGLDVLTIRDGHSTWSEVLETICNRLYSSSTTYKSTGRYMTIRFKTDSNNYFIGSTAGFKLKYREIDSSTLNTGAIVGIIFAVVVAIGLIACCVCIAKRKRTPGHLNRVPVAETIQTTTMTTRAPSQPPAPQYPTQMQGGPSAQGYPPPPGSYPPPQGYPPPGQASNLPPGQGSYPPAGSYPPPAGSYPPAGQGSYPPPGGSYPPVQGGNQPPGGYLPYPQVSYPPPVNNAVPDEPPPRYPGISATNPPYNPQFQGPPSVPPPQPTTGDPSPPYPIDNKTGGPPPF